MVGVGAIGGSNHLRIWDRSPRFTSMHTHTHCCVVTTTVINGSYMRLKLKKQTFDIGIGPSTYWHMDLVMFGQQTCRFCGAWTNQRVSVMNH